MDSNKVFVKTLNDYYDGVYDCNSIIIPNTFGIKKVEGNTVVGKVYGKEVKVTEKLCVNFNLIGNYVWQCLSQERKYLPYAIVGYISTAIKYNTNIIRVNQDIIKGIVGSSISLRTYLEAMSTLKRYNIIKDTKIRSIYEVNPLAIFKGSVMYFMDICEKNNINKFYYDGDKIVFDRFAVLSGNYKDKTNEKVTIIENKKEVKGNDKLSGLTFDFSKRVK